MTVVVSDTSPLNYLVLIGRIDLLPALYKRVLIPDEVLLELRDSSSPASVRAWALSPPDWIEVALTVPNTMDSDLDAGERAAIELASGVGGDVLVIMDDAAGRAEAGRLGLRITGTLGVLREASLKGLIDLADAIEKLRQTNFYLPERLVASLLDRQ